MPLLLWIFLWFLYLRKFKIPVMSEGWFSLFSFRFTCPSVSNWIIQICVEAYQTSNRKFTSLGDTCSSNSQAVWAAHCTFRSHYLLILFKMLVHRNNLTRCAIDFLKAQVDINMMQVKLIKQQYVITLQKYPYMWKKFSVMRVVLHWNRLSREAVDSPPLEVLKAGLDASLGNLTSWLAALPMTGGGNWVSFKVPSNPNHGIVWSTYLFK